MGGLEIKRIFSADHLVTGNSLSPFRTLHAEQLFHNEYVYELYRTFSSLLKCGCIASLRVNIFLSFRQLVKTRGSSKG